MNKLSFYILVFLVGALGNISMASNADFSGGEGEFGNPWLITTAAQLNKIRDNNGSDAGLKYFKLMNDIDLKEFGNTNNWIPINTNGAYIDLEGNGHVIKNLHISTGAITTPNYQSFVGLLFGAVRNLGLSNVFIDGPKIGSVGAFAGYVGAATPAAASIRTGRIENSFASGYLSSGGGAVGGITGFIGRPADDGTPSYIKNCYFAGELSNTYSGSAATVYTGGIAGVVKANEKLLPTMLDTMNIVSYNVKAFTNNPSFPNGNYQPIANILQSLNPAVVCLQELDSVTTRTNKVDQLKYLSQLTGWDYRFARGIPYKGGSYGVGITSPFKIISSFSQFLTSSSERRVFLVTEFEKFVMVSTHLDLDASTSVKQAQEITTRVRALYGSSNKPVFLAGDLNVLPSSTTMVEFRKNWIQLSANSFSFPAKMPDKCIDYILMLDKGQHYELIQSKVITSSPFGTMSIESDHLPIMITVVI